MCLFLNSACREHLWVTYFIVNFIYFIVNIFGVFVSISEIRLYTVQNNDDITI